MALLAIPLPHPAATAASHDTPTAPGVRYEWWGPTDETGWHFRLPVLVQPKLPDPLTKWGVADTFSPNGLQETPVRLEVDFSEAVRRTNADNRTGWPMDEFGRLSAFTFDPASVRVVAYDRVSGRVDPTLGRDGLVPHTFSPTLYENAEGRNPVYNATNNAIGTLQWMIPKPFDRDRLFFVYFDTLENGRKERVDWNEKELAPLRGLHFLRASTDLWGYLPAGPGVPDARVYVTPIYQNTTVAMYRYRYAGFDPVEVPPCARKGAAGMCLQGGSGSQLRDDMLVVMTSAQSSNRGSWEVRTAREPLDEPFFFKIVASKPVLAMIGPESPTEDHQTAFWVPSIDAGLAGEQFILPVHNSPKDAVESNAKNALFVVAGDKDVNANVFDSSGNSAFYQLKARTAERFDRYSGGDAVMVRSFTAGSKLLVASAPFQTHHASQGVSQYGAPVGTTVYALPTSLTGLGVVPHEDTAVTLYDLADASRAYPSDEPYPMEAGAENAWIPPRTIFPTQDGTVWAARSSGLSSVLAGDRGLWAVGGDMASDFRFFLRVEGSALFSKKLEAKAFVMPMYPQTRVDIERYDALRDRYVPILQKVVSPETYVHTKPGTAEPIMVANHTEAQFYRVRASKPVLVYAVNEEDSEEQRRYFPYQTFLGGSFRSPLAVLGDVEFYGPLVSWKEKLRQETVKPGDEVVVTFTLQNLGKSHDGKPVVDSFSVATVTRDDAPEWTTRLSSAFESNVPGGQGREITVVVSVPSDAKTDQTLDLSLVAVSEKNPAIKDTAVLQITVQTRYEIEALFKANNRPTLQSVIDPGTTREFTIRVKNLGSGPDGVSFTMLRENPFGFEADLVLVGPGGERQSFLDSRGLSRLGADGRPVSLDLGILEEKEILLVVTAPKTSDPAQHGFVIEATSTSDSSSRKQLQLVALTNARTALRIEASNDTFAVAPGRNATLPIEIVNEGVETAVDMTFRAAELPGWEITVEPASFELRSPGVLDPRDGRPLDRQVVNLTVRAGDGSPVGFLMPIEVTASSATRLGDAEVPSAKTLVTAVVVNNFTLLVPEILERSVLPGAVVEYDLTLRSLANGNFTVEPVATRLPSGWSLSGERAERVRMEPGDDLDVKVVLETRDNELAGLYQGEFGFVMEDELGRRGVVTAPFAVRVKRHVDYEAVLEEALVVPPEGQVRAAFTVRNSGNVNATLELSVAAPGGWRAELVNASQALLALAPGEAKPFEVRLVAPERPAADVARFELRGIVPLELDKTTPFNATILRDDLVLVEAKALTSRFRVGDPAVFQVTVLNAGTIPRANVGVALAVDGDVARNVTVRSLPPGEPRTLQIPWNVVPASEVTFLVDPENAYREEDETNNALLFDLEGARRTPGPTVLAFLVALGLALASRRPRRPA